MENKPRTTGGGNNNLRPLEPDIHGTHRWNFRGKNLSKIELKRLASKGVTNEDWMPDSRLKHPRLRRKRSVTATRMAVTFNEVELLAKQEARWREYQALPAPKLDYFDWAALHEIRQTFDSLEKIALNAGRTSDRIKALAIRLDSTKPKPKQLIETSEAGDKFDNLTPFELLKMALENCGIKPEKFKEFLESNPTITVQ